MASVATTRTMSSSAIGSPSRLLPGSLQGKSARARITTGQQRHQSCCRVSCQVGKNDGTGAYVPTQTLDFQALGLYLGTTGAMRDRSRGPKEKSDARPD